MSANFTVHSRLEEAPANLIQYGKEFWRHPLPSPAATGPAASRTAPSAPLNLEEIIERVSHAFVLDQDSSCPRVEAKSYEAILDGRGLLFSPYRAWLEPDGETALQLHTRAVRIGQQNLYAEEGNPVPWSVVGNTAQGLLNKDAGLIEHYEARAQGIEVSWVMQRRPPGSETLVIEAQWSGLSDAGQSSQGHHLADADGIARLRVGAATLVDARGVRTSLAMDVSENMLRIQVPATVLDEAVFPVAIDPLLSPEFGMDEPILTFSLEGSTDPAIASNGEHCLVVWADGRQSSGRGVIGLYGARVSAQGTLLDLHGIALNPNLPCLHPAVGSNGRDFLVAWRSGYTGGEVIGMRVTGDGVLLDTDDPIHIGFGDSHPRPTIASDGENYLVAWEDPVLLDDDDEDIVAARVTSDGRVLDSPPLIINAEPERQRGPALAYNGSLYLIVWDDDSQGTFIHRTRGMLLNRDGTPHGGVFEVGPGAPETFPTPAVASNGKDFLAALGSSAVRIAGDGALLGSVALGRRGIPAVACNGLDYLVVLQEPRTISAVMVSGAGAVLASGELTTIHKDYFNWSRPAVASTQGDFFAVWDDRYPGSGHILGALVTRTGTVAARDLPISTESNTQFTPAVASNGQGYFVVWQDFRFETDRDIFGVRVGADGTVLDPAALPIRNSTGYEEAPAVGSNGQDFFVVWQEYQFNTDERWHLYGRRITSAGALPDPARVPISVTSGHALVPSVASNGRDYLVCWTEWSRSAPITWDAFAARVTADAVVLDPNGFVVADTTVDEYSSSVASNGRDYLVAWSGFYPSRVAAARVTSAGVVLDPDGIVLADSTGEVNYPYPAVAFNGHDYLVAWHGFTQSSATDIFATRLAQDGTVLDSPALIVSSASGRQSFPSVASNGTDFLVAWSDERNPEESIFGARVTATGSVIERDGFFIATTRAYYDSGVALACSGGKYLAVFATFQEASHYRIHGRTIEFTLPPPWQDADVGAAGLAGGANDAGGAFTVSSAGTNIWGRADAFHFVYQTLEGDGEIVARVAALDRTHTRAKAGVMLRDGLAPEAKNVFVGALPEDGLIFQSRVRTGGLTLQWPRDGSVPVWTRLVRRGNFFIGYQSPDGVHWRLVWFAWVPMPASLQAGLAVASHDAAQLNNALFDHVSVIPRNPQASLSTSPLDPLAPGIHVAGPATDGRGVLLSLYGPVGHYVVEASTDLIQWAVLGQANNVSGLIEFYDTDASKFPKRFYRLREP